jgi:hypothetical protein
MVMALLVTFVAGLLVVAEAQASGMADRINPQGFLSKYLHFGTTASRTSFGDYSKFVIPSRRHIKHGADAISHRNDLIEQARVQNSMVFASAREQSSIGPKDLELPKIADKVEEQAAQKLFATGNKNMPIALFAIGAGVFTLVAMLGILMRRGLEPTVFASNTSVESNVSVDIAPGLGGDIMEMKSQDSNMNSTAALRKDGWGQLSSQNLRPLTVCCATPNPLKICHHKTCAKNGLAKCTLDIAHVLGGPVAAAQTAGCQNGCKAGTVSVVGPAGRVYDVEKASAATLAAILEIELDVAVSDAAVDACDALAAADAAQKRGDRSAAREVLRALLDDESALEVAPRLEALAAVRLFDLLAGEVAEREALEPILIRSATYDTAATWRLAALRGARGDCEGQRETLVALAKRVPAAVDAARELMDGCVVRYAM